MRGTTPPAIALDGAPRYDASAWPLFSIEMPPQRLSPAALRAHLAACSALFERGEPFFLLMDMAEHPALLASQRNEVAEAMQRDCERYPGLCRGLAVVVRSSFERSIAQTIHSMSLTSYPFAIFYTVADAEAWISSQEMLASEAPKRKLHEIVPPSRRTQSSAPPFSRARDSVVPFSRRAHESSSPPSSIRIEAPAPSSRQIHQSLAPLSRRPRDLR